VDTGEDPSPLGANAYFAGVVYIGAGLTSHSLGLALSPSDNMLEALLWVIGIVAVLWIYSIVMSPGPFPLLFLAFQFGIG